MPIFLRRFYVSRVNTIIEDRLTAQKQRAEQAKRKRAAIPNSPR